MKFIKLNCTLLFLFSSFYVKANYGCNIGSYIYPNATGGYNNTGDPTYYNTNPITIRTWDADPRCGIRDNKISPRSTGDDNCQIVGGAWGVIYYYNPPDNNCVPLPLDDYVWILILGIGIVGFLVIRNKIARNFKVIS